MMNKGMKLLCAFGLVAVSLIGKSEGTEAETNALRGRKLMPSNDCSLFRCGAGSPADCTDYNCKMQCVQVRDSPSFCGGLQGQAFNDCVSYGTTPNVPQGSWGPGYHSYGCRWPSAQHLPGMPSAQHLPVMPSAGQGGVPAAGHYLPRMLSSTPSRCGTYKCNAALNKNCLADYHCSGWCSTIEYNWCANMTQSNFESCVHTGTPANNPMNEWGKGFQENGCYFPEEKKPDCNEYTCGNPPTSQIGCTADNHCSSWCSSVKDTSCANMGYKAFQDCVHTGRASNPAFGGYHTTNCTF